MEKHNFAKKKRSVQTEIMLEKIINWLKKIERRTICRREFFFHQRAPKYKNSLFEKNGRYGVEKRRERRRKRRERGREKFNKFCYQWKC